MKNMNLLLIDNFDSFVYNIYQGFVSLGHTVNVQRNDRINLGQIEAGFFDAIIISPGPGNPCNEKDFGKCKDIITKYAGKMPILGICLGHQGIASAYGANIIHAEKPMHGKTSTIQHNGKGLFSGIENPLVVMRYHSLIVEESTLPECFEVSAKAIDDNSIMAIQHKKCPLFGIQFHPESIMTMSGIKILENFCKYASQKS